MAQNEKLTQAVRKGDVERVRRILDGGVSLSGLTDVWGWPLVHVAAVKGKRDVARLLWERDEVKDPRVLRRALHFAMQSRDKSLIRYFLDQGAVESAAMKCLYLEDLDGLRSLLASDAAQLAVTDSGGNGLLHLAANQGDSAAAALLIQAGAVVDLRNGRG